MNATTSTDDIFLWPNGTWCYRSDAESMTHLSDDYEVLYFDSDAYFAFLVWEAT